MKKTIKLQKNKGHVFDLRFFFYYCIPNEDVHLVYNFGGVLYYKTLCGSIQANYERYISQASQELCTLSAFNIAHSIENG